MRRFVPILGMLSLGLSACRYDPVGEAYAETDEIPYRILSRDDGSRQLEARIPVGWDWGLRSEDAHRIGSAPPGQAEGTWWRQTILHPVTAWGDQDEFWLGWWILDAYQIDRSRQTSPLALASLPVDTLFSRFADDSIHGYAFTEYIPPVSSSTWNNLVSGTSSDSAFGILFRILPAETLVVAQAAAGGPAAAAGLANGDRILSVDGRAGTRIVRYMRDSVGSRSALFSVLRSSAAAPETLRLSRAPVTTPAAYADTLPGGVGYVRLSQFSSGSIFARVPSADSCFRMATDWIASRSEGPWILDLRSNGGGYVEIARSIASRLVPAGSSLVRVRERDTRRSLDGDDTSYLMPDSTNLPRTLQGRKVLVLQDQWSASATEILISALRTNLGSRMASYGRTTFGKGIGQVAIPSPKGGYFKTTSMHLDPVEGATYNRVGIAPDFPTPDGDSTVVRAWNDALARGSARSLAASAAAAAHLDALEWNLRETTPSRPPPEAVRSLRESLRGR